MYFMHKNLCIINLNFIRKKYKIIYSTLVWYSFIHIMCRENEVLSVCNHIKESPLLRIFFDIYYRKSHIIVCVYWSTFVNQFSFTLLSIKLHLTFQSFFKIIFPGYLIIIFSLALISKMCSTRLKTLFRFRSTFGLVMRSRVCITFT